MLAAEVAAQGRHYSADVICTQADEHGLALSEDLGVATGVSVLTSHFGHVPLEAILDVELPQRDDALVGMSHEATLRKKHYSVRDSAGMVKRRPEAVEASKAAKSRTSEGGPVYA